MKEKKQGMKWFTFFTGIVPLISILELIFAVIMLFNHEYKQKNFETILSSIYQISVYIEVIMTVVLFFLVRKKYKHTVGYINALLIVQSISIVYGTAIADYEINSSLYAVVLLTFMTAILVVGLWYLPNIKYFERRKWYFEKNNEPEDETKSLDKINLNVEKRISKREKIIMIVIIVISAIITPISAAIIELDNDYLDSLKEKLYIAQEKADFLDENVVFIVEGDEVYYYTYDQVIQLPDEEFSYWVCTDVEAEGLGYKKWQ